MPKFICFCGVDGSGKTTQIDILCRSLAAEGREVRVIHVLSPNATAISRFHNKGIVGTAVAWVRALNDSLPGKAVKITARLTNILLDSWVTLFVNSRKYKGLVIYDRYFYDILVILASDYPGSSKFIMRFAPLIPRPQAVVVLGVDPEVSVMRKHENSLDDTRCMCALYRILADRVKCAVVDGHAGKTDTASRVRDLLGDIL